MARIEVNQLSVAYGGVEALSGVTFRVEAGDYIGIVGPNGSGKTTLVKALLGLVAASRGDVYFFGQPAQQFKAWGKIGYLPQKAMFVDPRFPATAREIVGSGLLGTKHFPKRLSAADQAAIRKVMQLLQIDELQAKAIGKLSGGQQQRVFLARSLVHQPEILILDEPTVALDPQARENFYALLQDLNRNQGLTILLVSHDIGSIGSYASRLLYLDRKIIFFGGFDEFCTSESMTDYFGSSSQHRICHRHGG